MDKKSSKKRSLLEQDFPRGGGSIDPQEYREIAREADQDLFATTEVGDEEQGPTASKEAKRKKTKKSTSMVQKEKVPENDDGEQIKLAVLKAKEVTKGMKFLGIITDIFDLEILVSLPYHLKGKVSITEISDSLSASLKTASEQQIELPDLRAMFKVGQWVQTVVLEAEEVEGKVKLQLSLRPELINKGLKIDDFVPGLLVPVLVESLEDHGYLLDTGIDIKGFLHHTQTSQIYPGQVITASVVKAQGRTVVFSTKLDKMKRTVTETLSSVTALLPGNKVDALILASHKNGLTCVIQGLYEATINRIHLNLEGMESPVDYYKLGNTVKARIINVYTGLNVKKIGLSLRSHLMDWEKTSWLEPIKEKHGEIYENLMGRFKEPKFGVYFKLDAPLLGFAHISMLSDSTLKEIDEKWITNPQKARMIGLDAFDAQVNLSLQPSILSKAFLRVKDIKPGEIVQGVVSKLSDAGVQVELTDQIFALVPPEHYADVLLSKPEKKFKPGMKVKARVLRVDPVRRRVILTLKKTLIQSDLPLITDYQNVNIGTSVHGYVHKINEHGCIIAFYGQMRGFCPRSELCDMTKDHRKEFYIGQPVKCTLLEADAARKLLKVSLLNRPLFVDQVDASVIGNIVKGQVIQVLSDKFLLILENRFKAILPLAHLSDHIGSHVAEQNKLIKQGSELDGLMIFNVTKDSKQVMVTKKPSLIEAAKAGRYAQLKEGEVVPGYVQKIDAAGVSVGFLGNQHGFVLMKNLSEQYTAKAEELFSIGQSLLCTVLATPEGERLQLSLLSPKLTTTTWDFLFLLSYFKERAAYEPNDIQYSPGSKVQVQVKKGKETTFGYKVKVEGKHDGFMLKEHASSPLNDTAVVLDVDPITHIIDVSGKGNPFEPISSFPSKSLNSVINASVLLAKEDYLVLQVCAESKNYIAYSATKSFNLRQSPFQRYKIGQKLQILIRLEEDRLLGIISIPDKLKLPSKVSDKVKSAEILTNTTTIDSSQDWAPGKMTKVLVKGVKGLQLNVELAPGVHGRIHISRIFENMEAIKNWKHPLGGGGDKVGFKKGQTLDAFILGFHNFKSHKFLPFSHRKSGTAYELSLFTSAVQLEDPFMGLKLEPGAKVLGYVNKVLKTRVFVDILPSLSGAVDLFDLPGKTLQPLQVGYALACIVKHFDPETKRLSLKLDPTCAAYKDDNPSEKIKVGSIVVGKIKNIFPNSGLVISVGELWTGRVYLTDIDDTYRENPTLPYQINQVVKCFILNIHEESHHLDLSLRPSRCTTTTKSATAGAVEDVEIVKFDDLKEGQVLRGYVKNIKEKKGCFVNLNRECYALVKFSQLSDEFVLNWNTFVKAGQLVKGRILNINHEEKILEMTLKPSALHSPAEQFSKIKVGDKIKGKVKRVETFGLFIQLEGLFLSGLCHRSEIADHSMSEETNLSDIYKVGDPVKVIVLKLTPAKLQMSLSMKPEHFIGDVDDDEDDVDVDYYGEGGEDVVMDKAGIVASKSKFEAGDPMQIDQEDEDEVIPALEIEGKVDWKESDQPMLTPSDSDQEDEAVKYLGLGKEVDMGEDEAGGGDGEDILMKNSRQQEADAPASAEEYERRLLNSPNSSYLWINYMAFMLETTGIESARRIVEKAVATVGYREEQEKKNLWVAWLNLEAKYGDAERLEQVFGIAVQRCEPKHIYLDLTRIYQSMSKYEEAEELWQKALKKFNQSCKVWWLYAQYLMKRKQAEQAHQLLPRALKCLPKRKHLKIVLKMALLEYNFGEPERARTMFESLLSVHHKRADLWSVYIDKEVQAKEHDRARRLFQRVITMSFTPRKIKFFFKKWLSMESDLQSQSGVEMVKKLALDYVESLQ